MSIKIVTDSTCDLPEEIVSSFDITVVPLYINIGDEGYLDGVELTRADFYKNLPSYAHHPTTGTPGPDKFRQVYEQLAAEGATQILSMHISISLSATIDAARLAASQTKAVEVIPFDSRQLSLGTGFLVETAARVAADGRTMDEILALLEDQIARTYVWAGLDTLEFLRRSGRMNGIIAGLGSLLQIKPLLTMYDGQPGAERVRTQAKATARLVSLLSEVAPIQRLAVVHTHAQDRAQELFRQVEHLLPEGEIPFMDITPVIGAHIGPGAAGFACITAP